MVGFIVFLKAQIITLLNNKKFFYLLSFLLIVLFACLRSESVGRDYPAYLKIFERLPKAANPYARYEFGFVFFVLLGNAIYSSPVFISFLMHFCMYAFLYSGINYFLKEEERFWGILGFLMLGFFFFSFNGLRQFMAISIAFFSVRYAERKNLLKFVFFIFLASSFHFSAWVFLPVYFLFDERRGWFVFLLLLALFVSLPYLAPYTPYTRHLGTSASRETSNTIYLLFSSISLFCALCTRYRPFIFIAALSLALAYSATSFYLINRIYLYFGIFLVVIVPAFIATFEPYARLSLKLMYFLFMTAYFAFALSINSNHVIPYTMILRF